MKIKILHIIKSLGRGGAEMLLPETLALHDHERFEFHYIYFLPWKDQMVSAIQEFGGHVTCISANNNIELITRFWKLKKYIKNHDIQLVHAHLPWAGFLARFLNKFLNIPVVYTEHNKQERYHKITFFLNKLTFRWQNRVIAVSKDVEKSILENIGNKTKVQTVLNGVNTHKFKKRPFEKAEIFKKKQGIPKKALVVGVIAVFRFQKRLKEWLQVFKEASEKNPDLYGIIVGDGPLKEELLNERARLGLDGRVLMPGTQINTVDWLSIMDIFMMSSIFEGLPIALLEAMSMECAILTTDAGGIKEVVENNQSGIMVEVDNWKLLGDNINSLSTKDMKQLGGNARIRVQKHFSLNQMVRELEEIYLIEKKERSQLKR